MYTGVSSHANTEAEGYADIAKQSVDALLKKIESLTAKLNTENGVMSEVKKISFSGHWHSNVMYYDDSRYGSSWKVAVANARKTVSEWRDKAEKMHASNIDAIANNEKARARIESVMSAIGIPQTYTTHEYKTKRSREKTAIKNVAGYRGDIERWLPVSDNYDVEMKRYVELEQQINDFERKMQAEERQQAAEKERKEQEEIRKRKADLELVALLSKYGLPIETDEYTLFDTIVNSNKYLRLAHYMQRNRDDWSDGPSLAQYGLDSFSAETETDREIYEQVSDRISHWDGDGRVFRDMEWSYDQIVSFGVPCDLHTDYQKAYAMIKE
jgi:vacuolar-type H+-ATPase subunit I/STV1